MTVRGATIHAFRKSYTHPHVLTLCTASWVNLRRYVDAYGAQKFVDMMHGYRDKYGEQFTPAQILLDYAKAGKKFYN